VKRKIPLPVYIGCIGSFVGREGFIIRLGSRIEEVKRKMFMWVVLIECMKRGVVLLTR
jgi:hypothetical protein